jgi:hypothetical protein
MNWVLLIQSHGDGDDPGRRFTSIRFNTDKAAVEARDWITEANTRVYATVIPDPETK